MDEFEIIWFKVMNIVAVAVAVTTAAFIAVGKVAEPFKDSRQFR